MNCGSEATGSKRVDCRFRVVGVREENCGSEATVWRRSVELREYDGKYIRLVDSSGEVFAGECSHNSDEYNEHEYGRCEESLQIENYMFFPGDICEIQEVDEREAQILRIRRYERIMDSVEHMFSDISKCLEKQRADLKSLNKSVDPLNKCLEGGKEGDSGSCSIDERIEDAGSCLLDERTEDAGSCLLDEKIDDLNYCLDMLSEYYTSALWKQDFADDEAGLLPQDLKRGVLSEDGVYNLLEKCKEITEGFQN